MTVQGNPRATGPKLPVWETATGSYGFVFTNLKHFVALAWVPLMVVVASSGVGELGDSMLTTMLEPIILYAMSAVFAVRWHRFFLLDERDGVFTEVFALPEISWLPFLDAACAGTTVSPDLVR